MFAMARTTIRQHADVRDGVEAIAFTGTETPLNDTRHRAGVASALTSGERRLASRTASPPAIFFTAEDAGAVAYVPLDLERPNLTPGFLPLVNSTPARSSASRIAPSAPNDGLRSSCSQFPTAALPTPASLANLACVHPNNALAARTCLGVILFRPSATTKSAPAVRLLLPTGTYSSKLSWNEVQ